MKLKSSHAFAMVAAGALLLTLLRPETSWLARLHIGNVLSGSQPLMQTLRELGMPAEGLVFAWAFPRTVPRLSEEDYTRTLAAHPDDIALHVAGALRSQGGALPALRALPPSGPRNAVLLRHACQGEGGISLRNRAVDSQLSSEPEKVVDQPVATAVLTAALTEARQGATLDTQNGFFPAMEAVALYGLKRDREAEAALHRVALCPNFDDGTRTELTGARELRRLVHGPQLGVIGIAQAAATLFPHYSPLRSMVRLATMQAIKREKAGDLSGGLALRRDALAVGQKLRDQSSSHIGTLVGNAIISLSLSRPGGAPSLTRESLGLLPECGEGCSEAEREADEKKRDAQFHAARLRQWREFSATHPEAATLIPHLEQSQVLREQVKANYFAANDRSVFGTSRISALLAQHIVSVNLLVTLVVLGGLAALCALAVHWCKNDSLTRQALGWAVILTFGYGLLPVALWRLHQASRSQEDVPEKRRRKWALLLMTSSLPLVLIFLLFWLEAVTLAPWLTFETLIQGLSGGDSTSSNAASSLAIGLFSIGLVLALPALWLAVLVVQSAVRRTSVTHGIVSGVVQTALPLIALLCLVYALQLPQVAREERQIQQELQEQTVSERAYLARLAASPQP